MQHPSISPRSILPQERNCLYILRCWTMRALKTLQRVQGTVQIFWPLSQMGQHLGGGQRSICGSENKKMQLETTTRVDFGRDRDLPSRTVHPHFRNAVSGNWRSRHRRHFSYPLLTAVKVAPCLFAFIEINTKVMHTIHNPGLSKPPSTASPSSFPFCLGAMNLIPQATLETKC